MITVIASGYQYIFCYRCNLIEEIITNENFV